MVTPQTSTGLMLTRQHEATLTRARLAALVACSADAIIGATLDGIVTDWNPAAERLYGYRTEEVIGRSLMMLIPADRVAETEAILGRVRSGETVERFETERWTKDGRRIDVELTIFPVRDETGQMIATSAILRDVTARKATEAALATSEARLRTLLEHVPAVIYTERGDDVGPLTYISPYVESFLGYAPEAFLAEPDLWMRRVHPDDRARVRAAAERAHKTGTPLVDEYRMVTTMGQTVWVHDVLAPLRDQAGSVLGWQGMALDVTARKAAEDALSASEARFRTAFTNAPIGMVLADPGFQVFQVNQALCQMLGYTEDELAADFRRYTHPDYKAANRAMIERALAGEISAYELEKRYIHKDGHVIWAHLSGSLVRDVDGAPRYFISQIEDITPRKAAEAEFAATLQHTGQVLERITDGFYALDRDWRFTYLNAAAEAMLGEDRKRLLGRKAWELFPHALELPTYTAFHEAMALGQTTSVEVQSPISERWFDVRAYPSADGLSVFFRDVTENRRLTEELQASESKYRSLIEQLPAVVYVLTADEPQRLTYISSQIASLTGSGPDAVLKLGQGADDFLHSDDLGRIAAQRAEARASGTPFHAEYRLLRKDGGYTWVRDECVPVSDEAGTVVAWQGVLLDISDLVAAEEAQTRLAAVVESAEDAIVGSLIDGTITSWNRGAERLYGYSAEEILGQSFLRLLPDNVADGTLEWRRGAVLAGKQAAPFETSRRRKDGTNVAASVALSAIRDRHGQIIGISSITRDITERKQLEEELRQALEAAQAGIRTKTLFLAMMSHELRTPLQAVLGYADFLMC